MLRTFVTAVVLGSIPIVSCEAQLLDANEYRPYPILVTSTVVPLAIPRSAVVAIASTQPFQDFWWSVVLKTSLLLWFAR